MEASTPGLAGEPCETVTITLQGETRQIDYVAGEVIIETAFRAGLRPAYSCLSGNCANCMAKLIAGTVTMRANHILTETDLNEGYILTCQAEPTSKHVTVEYEY
jgi:3-ketosteroid 9alpha-monooxygenase subunit B